MILITGAHKAFALYKAIEEGVNHMWTVSAFQQHPRTIFVCDEDATLELRVKTVKYFKGTGVIQENHCSTRTQPAPPLSCCVSDHLDPLSRFLLPMDPTHLIQLIGSWSRTVAWRSRVAHNKASHVFSSSFVFVVGLMHVHNQLVDPVLSMKVQLKTCNHY